MSSITARSNGTKWSDPGLSRSASSIADASWLVSFRATAMARYPTPVSLRAMAMPSPRLPPVTITLRIATHHFACRSDGQGRNEGDRRRNLVPRKRCAAEHKAELQARLHLVCRLLLRKQEVKRDILKLFLAALDP